MKVCLTLLLGLSGAVFAEDVATVVTGTVKKIDAGTKTVLVKIADGGEQTFHYGKKTAVHGAEATAAGSKEGLHRLKEGSEVAEHYTAKGGEKTANEVDHIGKEGLKASGGTTLSVSFGCEQ